MLEYIKYRWNAKGRHGTHSPFVYRLVDECFQIKPTEAFEQIRQNLFREFQKNEKLIAVTDLGAGSKKMSSQRKVSSIFKNSSSKGKYADLLYQLSHFTSPQHILEMGTSLGVGTMHMHFGYPQAEIDTVEGCAKTMEVAKEYFRGDAEKVHFIQSDFNSFFNDSPLKKYDLVFVDGHHDGEALMRYLELLTDRIHEQTIIILDDIRWSNSMYDAWKKIMNNPKYHLSIDLFRMGIISLRPGQEKEHFTIKL